MRPASIDSRSADRTAHAVRSAAAALLCLAALFLALPLQALAASPQISATSFSGVTESSATLGAKVDTLGAKAEYHFDYISRAAYEADGNSFGAGTAQAPTPPGQLPGHPEAKGDLSAGSTLVTNLSVLSGALDLGQAISGPGVPAGTTIEKLDLAHSQLTLSKPVEAGKSALGAKLLATGPQPVAAQLSGLASGTAYLFRAIAKNSKGEEAAGPTATFYTLPSTPVFGSCANDVFRFGQYAPPSAPSAALPDCRAYEQATPLNKDGSDALGTVGQIHAAADGSGVNFMSTFNMPGGVGEQGFPQFAALRGEGDEGWSSLGLLPPAAYGQRAQVQGFSPDYSRSYSVATRISNPLERALLEQPSSGGPPTAITPFAPAPGTYNFLAASADGQTIAIEAEAKLPANEGDPPIAAAIQGRPNVYAVDRGSGEIHLASVLNDGSAPFLGSFPGPYAWPQGTNGSTLSTGGSQFAYYLQGTHAITDSGDVFFTAAGTGQLYERINPTQPQSDVIHPGEPDEECTEAAKACTIHLSASHRTTPDPAGSAPAAFMAASPDGSTAYFTSPEKLTDDANTGPEQAPADIGRATLGGATEPEDVRDSFLSAHALGIATSSDGQHIYWANPADHSIGRAKLNGEAVEDLEPNFIALGEGECELEVKVGVDGNGFDEFELQSFQIPSSPRYVAIDEAGKYLYWTNTGLLNDEGEPVKGHGTIGRAELGSGGEVLNVEPAFICGEVEPSPGVRRPAVSDPQGIAVNADSIYWANNKDGIDTVYPFGPGAGSIARAPIGGGEVEADFIGREKLFGDDAVPYGVALTSTHLYFGVEGRGQVTSSLMGQAKLDGSEAFMFSIDGLGIPGIRGTATDGTNLYWATQGNDSIARMPIADIGLGGCQVASTCEPEFIHVSGKPDGLALDPATHHLFWSVNGEAPGNDGNDLYRFDQASGSLNDITVSSAPKGAEVQGVLGTSADGSYLYFSANADLDGSGPAQQGDCTTPTRHGEIDKTTGSCWIYLYHAGQISAVARVSGGDWANWTGTAFPGGITGSPYTARSALVSADGGTLLFSSKEELTAYDNHSVTQLYRFEVGAPELACLSCRPSGEAPGEGPRLQSIQFDNSGPSSLGVAMSLARNLSADGRRAYFETSEALLAADTNGSGGCPPLGSKGLPACLDVYEWEAPGAGSCTKGPASGYSPLNEGCLYLISTGTSTSPSFFADASASGDDVFFFTRSRLVGQDTDSLQDIYDARIEGGLAAQNLSSQTPCEGVEACRGPYEEAAAQPSPGSTTFSGPPDPTPTHPKPPHHCKKHGKRTGHCRKHGKHQHRRHQARRHR